MYSCICVRLLEIVLIIISKGNRYMNTPILVVLAAGLGSRYGGLKQIAPVDDEGHILIDYALYDAKQAGFDRVIFIITPALEKDFREVIGNRVAKHMEVNYAFQTLDLIPSGFEIPSGRTKPWGTAHAVLSAKNLIDANFASINADDYYGADAYRKLYDFLINEAGDGNHAMIGYRLGNTLTDYGHVARGICKTENDMLVEIAERTHVETRPGGGAFTEDGENFTFVPGNTVVSMNIWAFGRKILDDIDKRFSAFLKRAVAIDPLKSEYYLPVLVNDLLQDNVAKITVIPTEEKWLGVTYAKDMPPLRITLGQMRNDKKYPRKLWGEPSE